MATPNTPLWEVFIRSRNVTGAQAFAARCMRATPPWRCRPRATSTPAAARGLSIWVVPSNAITASDPSEKGMMFEPAESKIYRHPTFYDVPEDSRAYVISIPHGEERGKRVSNHEAPVWFPLPILRDAPSALLRMMVRICGCRSMAVPSIQVSETPLVLYTLRRADDALILGHRLSEWCWPTRR